LDPLSPEQRSAHMARIRGKDTTPEKVVRRLCCELGLSGYRIHRKDLPGKPDLAWIGKKRALFVNGCFWHSHNCGSGRRVPNSNSSFWAEKLKRNRNRDAENIRRLRNHGWKVEIIWECELSNVERVSKKLMNLTVNASK